MKNSLTQEEAKDILMILEDVPINNGAFLQDGRYITRAECMETLTQKLYRVRLLSGHDAHKHQIKNGCLAFCGQIQLYTRGQALKKSLMFGGKIEEVK